MRKSAFALSLSIVAACQSPPPEQTPAQSTAIAMTEIRPGSPLDEMLRRLDEELVRAMAGRMEGEAVTNFRRAEAISDRLLEARLPFEWITSESYSLEARLRQIQSSADRVHAQFQTGAPWDEMQRDLTQLRRDVVRLRQVVASGGGRAPPALEQLLADTAVARPQQRARPDPVAPAATPDTTAARDG